MSLTSSAAERVDMERHETVRLALDLLHTEGIPKDQVIDHVVRVLLASVQKQYRWSGGAA